MDTGIECLVMAGKEQLDLPQGSTSCGFGSCLATERCGSCRLGRFEGCAVPPSLALVSVCSLSVEKRPFLAGYSLQMAEPGPEVPQCCCDPLSLSPALGTVTRAAFASPC